MFHMEVVRKYINASSLMSIMKLPENFKNRKLEVIVLPTEEKEIVEKEVNANLVQLVHAGNIGSRGYLNGNSNVWLNRISRIACAHFPAFFADGKYNGVIHRGILLQQGNEGGAAGAVV